MAHRRFTSTRRTLGFLLLALLASCRAAPAEPGKPVKADYPTNLAGDVTGPAAFNTLSKIDGITLPAPSPGVLTYDGGFTWSPPGGVPIPIPISDIEAGAPSTVLQTNASGSVVSAQVTTAEIVPCASGQVLLTNGTPAQACTSVSGDVVVSSGGVATVQGLQSRAINATAPTNGQGLVWNSGTSMWTPTTGTGTSVTGTGTWYSAAGTLNGAAVQCGGDVSCTAALSGGNLPYVVLNVNGASVPAAGALTSGNVLQVSGASALTYAPITLSNASSVTAGTGLPTLDLHPGTSAQVLLSSNIPVATWTTVSGDTTISNTGVTTTAKVNGITITGTPSSTNVPIATSSTSATWGALVSADLPSLAGDVSGPVGSNIVGKLNGNTLSTSGALTKGDAMFATSTSTWAQAAFSGDLTCSSVTPAACTVGALQGNAVASGALTKGDALFATGTTTWAQTAFTGDMTCSASTPGLSTVNGAQNGEYGFGSSGTTTMVSGATVLQTQASTSAATASNWTIAPQQSTNANASPGNVVLNLGAETGTGQYAQFQLQRSGSAGFAVGSNALATVLYMGPPASTQTATNMTLMYYGNDLYVNNSSGIFEGVDPNFPTVQIDGDSSSIFAGMQLFDYGVGLDYGGGVGILGISTATTLPTSLPGSLGSPSTKASVDVYNNAGSLEIAAKNSVFQFSPLSVSPTIAQVGESSVVKGQDLILQPEISTHATNAGGGNLIANMEAISGSGAEAYLAVCRGGTTLPTNARVEMGALPTSPSYGAVFLGPITPTASNYTIVSDGATQTVFNSSAGPLNLGVAGTYEEELNSSGAQFFPVSNGTFDLGGGVGVLGVGKATTLPTTSLTSGDSVVASDTNGIHFYSGANGNILTAGSTSGVNVLWLGTPSTFDVQHAAIYGSSAGTILNGPSATFIDYRIGNTQTLVHGTTSGVQLFSGTSDLGGGVNVLGISGATTSPSTVPSSGDAVLSSQTSGLYADLASSVFATQKLLPVITGTNTGQAGTFEMQGVWGTTTSESAVTMLTVPTVSNKCSSVHVVADGRVTVSQGTRIEATQVWCSNGTTLTAATPVILGTASAGAASGTLVFTSSGTNGIVQAESAGAFTVQWTLTDDLRIN